MERPSFRPGQPSEPPSYRDSTRISRNVLRSLLLTLLVAVPFAAQDITGSYRRTTTTPSRDQQTTGNTGGGEPTRIIIVPQFPVFSDCPSGTPKGSSVQRARILGVAHMALYVSDLSKTRAFYKEFLGFEEPFSLKRDDGTDRIVFIKINDRQYLELFAEASKNDGRLNHISIYTDDALHMRDYLASHGVKVPEKVGKGKTGNLNFNIKDPDNHTVEIVEYQPDSWTAREAGKYTPANRISDHMMHVGFLVGSLDPAMKFYRDILGFQEFWRGSPSAKELSWVNMRVPDGEDYIEFMLYSKPPDEQELGVKNHVCLVVPSIEKAVAALQTRAKQTGYTRSIEMRVGVNRKRQVNVFDPDGTRIELMEPNTIDGQPAPSSTAPAPR